MTLFSNDHKFLYLIDVDDMFSDVNVQAFMSLETYGKTVFCSLRLLNIHALDVRAHFNMKTVFTRMKIPL